MSPPHSPLKMLLIVDFIGLSPGVSPPHSPIHKSCHPPGGANAGLGHLPSRVRWKWLKSGLVEASVPCNIAFSVRLMKCLVSGGPQRWEHFLLVGLLAGAFSACGPHWQEHFLLVGLTGRNIFCLWALLGGTCPTCGPCSWEYVPPVAVK